MGLGLFVPFGFVEYGKMWNMEYVEYGEIKNFSYDLFSAPNVCQML